MSHEYMANNDSEHSEILFSCSENEVKSKLKNRIMVIDDCRDTLFTIKYLLERETELDVYTFSNEFIAMKNFSMIDPNVLIIDINLKKLNGFYLSSLLHRMTYFNLPTIFISASNINKNQSILDVIKASGEYSFIQKPFSSQKLESEIFQLIK